MKTQIFQIFQDFRIFGFFRDFLKLQIWTQDMRFLVWARSRSSDPASVKTQIFQDFRDFRIFSRFSEKSDLDSGYAVSSLGEVEEL